MVPYSEMPFLLGLAQDLQGKEAVSKSNRSHYKGGNCLWIGVSPGLGTSRLGELQGRLELLGRFPFSAHSPHL